jgi:2-polyprenyl-3-methyl-5-hydroxy-6-metoxy-1,4-benzoquinol methylase
MPAEGHMATEARGLAEVLERLPDIETRVQTLMRRLRPHLGLVAGARIMDIGAAQGEYVLALSRAGYDAVGVEPWQAAIDVSGLLARETGVAVQMVEGVGEELPFEAASFDLAIAISVMEHVDEPQTVMSEVARVLRPGGGFYFYTSSAVCPRQNEISRFPAFPWYPQPIKKRIMDWAVVHRPELVGHTTRPAYHWYTPWGTRRMLAAAGFARVFDRWQLKLPEELHGWRRTVLEASQRHAVVRLLGDVAVPESAYLAIRAA